MVLGSTGEDMLWWYRSIVGGMTGGSRWILCISSALFYLVQETITDFSGDMPESAVEHVRGLLTPTCCLHLGTPSI